VKALVLKKPPANNGAAGRCRHCGKAMRTGEAAVHQKMPNNPFGDRDMFFHIRCLADVLERGISMNADIAQAAQDDVARIISVTRQRIIETGDPFCDIDG
jgi:hypothetical protein